MKNIDQFSMLFRGDRNIQKIVPILILCFSLAGFFVVTLSFLSANGQLVVGVAGIIAFFVLNNRKDETATLYLKILSLAVSFRYLAWRMIDTLVFQTTFQAVLGITLLLAESYAFMMLLLIYFQTVHPLERKPASLPDNTDEWPSIDVYVPTYNEDLSIVRVTALACASMDWPPDKLNVYILDDGHREEFRKFAESAGVGYISRADNAHAKAGNLNHALHLTDGDMIAIFDCDHVPCRAFLQTTLGWFLADPKIGLLQTPHHFYSPDPFQRNLANGMRVPPEGNSFYGLLQPGNDFWNASFFCGSCAVIRRTALLEVGGIATETVTEDAHTALKLQRRGWSTAYLSLPLAAGLATERLMLHIGQRMRWARGMIQILRTDNPFSGPGLNLSQRICYFSAMAGFLFALPRLVFLISPLFFLVFNQTLIAASPLALCAYVIPHFFHCICTSARMNGNWRYSFWGEIYETTLATFLVRVTLVTMLFPKLGKFNVTDKGGTIKQAYLDWRAVYPNVILAGFLLAGMFYGFYRLFMFHNSRVVFNALWLNEIWISISILTLLLAIAVGHESRQVRGRARIQVRLPVTLRSEGGRLLPTHIMDVSTGGCQVEIPDNTGEEWKNGQIVNVLTEEGRLKGEVVWIGRRSIGLDWRYDSLRHEAEVVRFVFGRADAWVDWGRYPPDRPLRSLWLVVSSITSLFRFEKNAQAASQKLPPSKPAAPSHGLPVVEKKQERKAVILAPKKKAGVASFFLIGMMLPALSWAQQVADAPPAAPPAVAPSSAQAGTMPSVPPAGAPAPDGEPPLPSMDATAPAAGADQGAPASQSQGLTLGVPVADASPPLVGVHKKSWSLKDLGAADTLMMTPFASIQGISFGLPKGELVTDAELVLSGALSPALLPTVSSITIRLNDQYVGTIPVTPGASAFGPIKFTVNPFFFLSKNVINFSFAGQYTATCGNEISPVLWGQISGQSQLSITTAPLPPKRYLSALPSPFLDPQAVERGVVPFVLPEQTSVTNVNGRILLKSAGIVASWFGKQADFHHVTFPVSYHVAETGNAVVVGTAATLPDNLGKGLTVDGPLVAELANPSDSNGTLLVITGRTATEVLQAANTLAYTANSFGDLSQIGGADISLSPRVPYDAPAFLPTDRVVRFGELVSQSALTGHGYVPGTLAIPFRMAPDLYTWRGRPFYAHFSFHPPLADNLDLKHSRVDVSLNGIYLNSFPWSQYEKMPAWLSAFLPQRSEVQTHSLELPVWGVYGQNELGFYFDGRPMARRDCSAMAQDISLELDPDSVLDMRRAYHLAVMPNLALFANSGFPFTRMADLSETAIVLPDHAGAGVLTAYLDAAGLFGSYTWLPVSGVEVVSAKDVAILKNRDILMIGLASGGTRVSGPTAELLKGSPYQIEGDRLRLKERTVLDGIRYMFADSVIQGAQTVTFQGSVSLSGGAAIIGTQSPLAKGRSVVVMVAGMPQGLDNVINTIENPTLEKGIQGDLTFVTGHKILASRSGTTFTVGNAPFWIWSDWYFSEHPWRIIMLATLGIFGSGSVLRKMLAAHAAKRRAYLKKNEGGEA